MLKKKNQENEEQIKKLTTKLSRLSQDSGALKYKSRSDVSNELRLEINSFEFFLNKFILLPDLN